MTKKKETVVKETRKRQLIKNETVRALLYGLGLAAWVFAAFTVVQIICVLIARALFSNEILAKPISNLIFSAVTYVVAVAVIIFVPWKLIKLKTTRDELGLRGLPTWTDILMAPLGLIVTMFGAGILMLIMKWLIPGINLEQEQDVGFNNLIGRAEMIEGFIALVIIAPIAEELIFRGWLYGKLRARMTAVSAIIICSALFGILHGQWNVGITVFAMSVVMCLIRELTGTIWSGILVHMLKNGIAFYLLYVVMM